MNKPREFWIVKRSASVQLLECAPSFPIRKDQELIHVREVLPNEADKIAELEAKLKRCLEICLVELCRINPYIHSKIHREVFSILDTAPAKPERTDTERLDWLLKNYSKYADKYCEIYIDNRNATPRFVIDAAMDQEDGK